MSREEIIEFLGPDWSAVQGIIRSALSSDVPLLDSTNLSVLSNSGKMLRPMLTLLCAEACGGCGKDSARYAAGAELLHNATLIHDDITDNSALRRGKPSVLSMLGPGAAVLVGDFWLAEAVNVLLGSEEMDRRVLKLFSKTLTDLSEGEMLQLEKSASTDTSEEDYYRIIYCKTASLFETACVAGAISAEADEERSEAVRAYSKALGMAFQIKDDILDYEGGEDLGKPLGADIREKKITLPLLGALRNVADGGVAVRDAIRKGEMSAEEVCAFVRDNDGVGYAVSKLESYIGEAMEALQSLPAGKSRDYLAQISDYNRYRRI